MILVAIESIVGGAPSDLVVLAGVLVISFNAMVFWWWVKSGWTAN